MANARPSLVPSLHRNTFYLYEEKEQIEKLEMENKEAREGGTMKGA
jgi:hypothetical protein